jgi:hypothetical protein
MNALQSLSASGVHAIRCSDVPCEKEAAGEAVADSKTSDTHHCTKAIGRSIQLLCLSMFIGGLACISKPILDIVIMADRNTLLPEFALVAKRLPLELSIPLQSFHFPKRAGRRADVGGCPARSVSPSTSVRTNHQVIARLSKRREQYQR